MRHRITTLIASTGLAAATAASAQTAFDWNNALGGNWTDTASWNPTGFPGQLSSLDTATIATLGEYLLAVDVTTTIASLDIANSDAAVRVNPSTTLTITDAISGPGLLEVSNGGSTFNSYLVLHDGATIGSHVRLNGVTISDAQLILPSAAGESATLLSGGVISGKGILSGNLTNEGTIRAEAGDIVSLSLSTATLEGGFVDCDPAGDIAWNNHTITNVTLQGDIRIDPAESIFLGPGVVFESPLTISNGSSTFDARLTVLDGVTLNAIVELNGVSASDADLFFPTVLGESGTLGPGSVIMGRGNIGGYMHNTGLIHARAGDYIDLHLTNTLIDGGTVQLDEGGDIAWNNHTLRDVTIVGDTVLDPAETLNIDTGNVFGGDIVLGNGASTFDSVLNVLDGVTIDTNIVLQGLAAGDADLRFPTIEGELASLAPGSTISGKGNLSGYFLNQGTISIGEGGLIDLHLAENTLEGGTIDIDPMGEINWNNHTLKNVTLTGAVDIDPGETVYFSEGVSVPGSILVSNGDSTFDAQLRILDGIELDTTVILNGIQPGDADIFFPQAEGESATTSPDNIIMGTGSLLGYFTNQGLIHVGPGEVLNLSLSDGTLKGGTLRFDEGADIRWSNHTITNLVANGNLVLDPGESFTIGTGVTITDKIVVSNDNSTFDSILVLADALAADFHVELHGFGTGDADIEAPLGEGLSASLSETSLVTGNGEIRGNMSALLGTLSPGTDTASGNIAIRTNDTAMGPSTLVEIDIFAIDDTDKLSGNATVELGGTLVLRPRGDYIPTLGDTFVVVDNPNYTGAFDEVADLPGETPYLVRARYNANNVEAIVTCVQDLSGDGITDIDDVLAFLAAFSNEGAVADLAAPIGTFNIDDILTFLNLFASGCF